MIALFSGLFAGLSLIIAIGAQNAFVIRQGLTRQHVFLVVAICAASDALLISLGAGGLGALIQAHSGVLEVVRWFGVVYLTWFGIKSLRAALASQVLNAASQPVLSRNKVITTTLALTFLNPHVYLDTVILLGAIANQFPGNTWYFAAGAMLGSLIWFTSIGYGAKAASKYMSKPIFWKVLDLLIAGVMFGVASYLAFHKFN
jgi:L-lysine exporter family protein LysE/ArgO